MVHRCKVVDAHCEVLAELTEDDGEAFALAEVSLADPRPRPSQRQPPSLMAGSTYFLSDVLLPAIAVPVYRKGRRWWRSL